MDTQNSTLGRRVTMPGELGQLARIMGGVNKLAQALQIPERTLRGWAIGESQPNPLAQAQIDRLAEEYLVNPDGTRQFVVEILRVNDRRTGGAYLNSFVSIVGKPINIGQVRKKVSIDGLLHEMETQVVHKDIQQQPGGNLVISWLDLLVQEGSAGIILRLRALHGPTTAGDLPYRDSVDGAMLEFGTQGSISSDPRSLRREYTDLLEIAFSHYIQARKSLSSLSRQNPENGGDTKPI